MGSTGKVKRTPPPARTLEGRENQLINLAVDEAEKRLRNGTASSQIITTLLHMASVKAQLELEKLRGDILLSSAKVEQIKAQETNNELLEKALNAFRSYSGSNIEEDEYEDDY